MSYDPLTKLTRECTESPDPDVQLTKDEEKSILHALEKDSCILNQRLLDQENAHVDKAQSTVSMLPPQENKCFSCPEVPKYRCPQCGIRSCSLSCLQEHKIRYNCEGKARPERYLAVSDFTNSAIRKDFSMLVATQRFVDNSRRAVEPERRYNHKDLSPPLQLLSRNARKNGVVLQILSSGLRKRQENTSRYVAQNDTLIWRVDFIVHLKQLGNTCTSRKISTDWGSERFQLGEIFEASWERNPQLATHEIKRGYNKASSWVTHDAKLPDRENGHVGADEASGENSTIENKQCSAIMDTIMFSGTVRGTSASEKDENRRAIHQFLAETGGSYKMLYKAERLGSTESYFLLDPTETLAANLRSVFYVVEYPVIHVIAEADLCDYHLVTDNEKSRIREGFRKRKPERQERQTIRGSERNEGRYPDSSYELKTEIPCANYIKGYCKLGKRCKRTHYEPGDLPMCRSIMKGLRCPLGDRCLYSHDPSRAPATQYYDVVKGRNYG
ncbi:Lariat debranching enzyme [Perkinsela sp. CCAP 1560/4]|nr:Lariat debranching enzyme [Perkinsela sp. CCAP 1560/4]|eukprot:KNH06104.1 Lariat debranching enzyme [Perkinsela sp. CCAP 1560/4]